MLSLASDSGREAIPAHSLSDSDVLQAMGSDRAAGLSAEEVLRRRSLHGENALTEPPPTPMWLKLLGQFNELVIWILIVAAVISGAMGEWADTAAILAIVLLNGVLGFIQEEKAERALAALQKLSAPMAKVIRNRVLQSIPARELVPGDRVELEAGDHIPADLRLLEVCSFRVQEAALTGESVPVGKDARSVLEVGTPLGDRRNMAYMGTIVAAGKASAVVTATGMRTELGRIASLLQEYEREPTPLQRRLTELGKVLVAVCLGIVAVIFVLEMLRGGSLPDVFLRAVSLAVAAVPEGLPAVVTMALALGLQRMVRRNALVRKLPSVETLGSVTVICSDKTGTLTRNEMTVRVVVAGGERYDVTGTGYVPQGQFLKRPASDAPLSPLAAGEPGEVAGIPVDPGGEPDLAMALTIGARCNNAQVVPRGDAEDAWTVFGDPTEGALVVLALKAGIESGGNNRHLLYEIPFDSQRKAMSVVVAEPEGGAIMYTKGAPEVVLSLCEAERLHGRVVPLVESRRAEILRLNAELAAGALRVLGLAYRPDPEAGSEGFREGGLIFVGLAGMLDPPREEVKAAVRRCFEAGIRPVMITGDHPATALAIARELHMARPGDAAVSGSELDRMSDDELAERVDQIPVYARVSAEHKLRVVEAWKRRGQIVAMTGDGVNDAPAVKAADIGIGMGITGTDVTKEASDMVLTDDNFASIVSAVEEGRGIFDNIQKFVRYLLTCNTGEVLFMFFAALAGWKAPLTAIQILWINLVTDGLPALALGMEPPEPGIMSRKPRPPREPVITLSRGIRILAQGALIAAAAAAGFHVVYAGQEQNLEAARTVAFCIMAFSQLAFSFACRSERFTLPQLGLFTNPYLIGANIISALLQLSVVMLPVAQKVFETSAHGIWQWEVLIVLSLAPATVVEVAKILRASLFSRQSGNASA